MKHTIDTELQKPLGEISIIQFVDLIVEYAYVARASDIHLSPEADKIKVKFRVDGILREIFNISKELQNEIITRIKVISGMHTDIHHVPQDGRFMVELEGVGQIDIRVSIAPTYFGENAVMRMLVGREKSDDLRLLGFLEEQVEIIERAATRPYGMILANGPTGSGKTTTLYTILKKITTSEISTITIEDPIEYAMEGITQMPLNVKGGLTFAGGLRAMLRQDPDVIMVGEIRDPETAGVAVNAALTGHLMFSTLHTNDAATTFPRLVDMGVPPFLIASTVNVVIAQRLVRIACKNCVQQRILSVAEVEAMKDIIKELSDDKVYTIGEGCEECAGSGYRGRSAIAEVLEVNDDIRGAIMGQENSAVIRDVAIKGGMKTIIEHGFLKALTGETTIEEVLQNVHE